MFTVTQIEEAHAKVKSGSGFPQYIQEIKQLGVLRFETWVKDSHTIYFGANNYSTQSVSKYTELTINPILNKALFIERLRTHQQGNTDYYTFCKDCAVNGVVKWLMDLNTFTCTYFDIDNNIVFEETIPH
ncbi:DUF1398 domain-containing protein [Rhizosphaericola mali]|uniref:DUF1398 domain-containing protein n=1 Tax=Rhizosphaericola mali TaxID=2545455 RepID=A0A5P2FW02_9BACT|nr:DUF1398 family protein [Rhizosphaericola mali]QES87335.1 DUF1398 domain-containing protein [Rhizosphaericola mali]